MTVDPARARLVAALYARALRHAPAVPLTATQEGIWLAEQLEPGRSGYHDTVAVQVTGPLDPVLLRAALHDLQARHESLRCRIVTTDGDVRQMFDVADVAWATSDLSPLPADGRAPVLRRLTGLDATEPFDLAAGPLWRVRLVRLDVDVHVLVLVLHHLITDGWSHAVLLSDLLAAYVARAEQSPPAPAAGGYAQWLTDKVRRETDAGGVEAAAGRLHGAPRTLDLPGLDRGVTERRADALPLPVAPETWQAFGHACRQRGATAYMGLAGLFGRVLAHAAGTTEVVLEAPVADRAGPGASALVGCMIDLALVRVPAAGDDAAAVQAGRHAVFAALTHASVPYRAVARRCGTDPGGALTNVALMEFNVPGGALQAGPLRVEPLPRSGLRMRYDLALSVPRDPGQPTELLWPVQRWAPDAVAATADRLAAAVRSVAALAATPSHP